MLARVTLSHEGKYKYDFEKESFIKIAGYGPRLLHIRGEIVLVECPTVRIAAKLPLIFFAVFALTLRALTKKGPKPKEGEIMVTSHGMVEKSHLSWSLDLLNALEWKRFEEVVSEYYRLLGYRSGGYENGRGRRRWRNSISAGSGDTRDHCSMQVLVPEGRSESDS